MPLPGDAGTMRRTGRLGNEDAAGVCAITVAAASIVSADTAAFKQVIRMIIFSKNITVEIMSHESRMRTGDFAATPHYANKFLAFLA
jgi:hypothetical protein